MKTIPGKEWGKYRFPAQLLLFLLVAAGFALSSPAQAEHRNILILHSYHVGYKWTDDIHQGIMETLAPRSGQVSLHVEYLDMKRYYSEARYYQTALWMGQKYATTPIDLIITTDDTAFIFAKEFGQTLFPDTPVFFCGTNYLDQADLEGLDNYFGITETADISSTLQTILDLLPATRQVFIVNDTTVTGQRVHQEIAAAIDRFRSLLSFTFLEDISMADLVTRVSRLPENSVILYTFFFRDKTGQAFEYDQSISLIRRQAKRPIFGAWDFNLDLGIVGGMLVSGKEQGIAVAQLALSWIDGTPLEKLPRVTSSPNRFIFDHREMKAFGISSSQLPRSAEIINSPQSFFKKHRDVLIGASILSCLLVLVIITLSANIMRRKAAEKELRQSEKNFRDIFNNASEGMYQSTRDGRFIRVNPALATMLKCNSPEEVIDHYRDLDSQLYPTPQDRQNFHASQDDSGWVRMEMKVTCRDGSEIDVIESCHSVFDQKGRFRYYEGSFIDMTEYKHTQELIAQTDKMLSLGGVSAGIAHEIRSPLSTVALGSQVLATRLVDTIPANLAIAEECGVDFAKVRDYVKRRDVGTLLKDIHDSALRAGVIVDDMLSYSKKSIGEFRHESLPTIVAKSVELARKDYNLRHECGFLSIDIQEEYAESLRKVYCSASKIQQVLFNILKNGAEAMAEAKTARPRFSIRVAGEEDTARIEIQDNGPGMSLDLQKKIFQPFYTTKGREKGTGLGLSVSSFIIKENHHGELKVDSEPGMGTTFIIRLPYDHS